MRRSVVVLTVLVMLAATAACGGTDGDEVVSDGSTPSTTSTTVAETTTTTAAPATTTTAAPSPSGVVLGADGLGIVSFGQDPDSVIATLDGALGPATSDSDWVDAGSSDWGFCPGPQVRGVEWGSLTLLFSDGDTAYGTSGEQAHLFTYRLSGSSPAATTAEGIGLGSSSEAVRAAYGDAATSVPGDELVAPRIDVQLGGSEPLRATLDDAGTVIAIDGGAPCGE